jgi:hypothetical protein
MLVFRHAGVLGRQLLLARPLLKEPEDSRYRAFRLDDP